MWFHARVEFTETAGATSDPFDGPGENPSHSFTTG
jgi:hypothetical protein